MEKIKAGVFIGLQTRLLFRDPQFDLVLSDDEKAAWNAFRHVAFSRKFKSHQLQDACGGSYNSLREARLQRVTQDAFSPFTLGFLSVNCGAVNDEHGGIPFRLTVVP
jgi:hypothetical protein